MLLLQVCMIADVRGQGMLMQSHLEEQDCYAQETFKEATKDRSFRGRMQSWKMTVTKDSSFGCV